MKASSATSATAATPLQQPTARSSAQPSRISAEGFSLAGPSSLPDPATHAYRKDLADVALAGRVIASHFAEPLERAILSSTPLRGAPAADSAVIATLAAGDTFMLLDSSRGWAWGYAGPERMVGYVPAEVVGRA